MFDDGIFNLINSQNITKSKKYLKQFAYFDNKIMQNIDISR